MATALELRFDTSPWARALGELGRRGPVALARGLNRTASSERTALARAVAKDMGIKVGKARDAMSIKKATAQHLVARVVATGKRLPLINFKARGPVPTRGVGRGVTAVVQGVRKTYAKAFIATTTTQEDGSGGSHRGVFIRATELKRVSRGGWGKNLPIKQLYGVSIAVSFQHQLPVGEARRNEVLQKNVQHEIEFELSRLKA